MTFNKFLNNRVVYLSAFVLLAVMASGLYMMTDSTTVSAQRDDISSRGETAKGVKGEVAREDMLAIALNMRTANDQTAFGQKGIRGEGSVSGRSVTGADTNLAGGVSGVKVRSDLSKSFSIINQLPCTDMGGELTGGTFTPGVYCAPSAALAGNMTLDGDGTYIFRVDGKMRTADDFGMTLSNGAKGGSVYFVAGDTASIASYNTIEGSIIARNTVDVGAGATVKGRAFSMDSEVILGASSNLVLQTGVIEICKEAFLESDLVAPSGSGFGNRTLANRIFRFEVNGVFYEAPVGGCTGPIQIASNTPTTVAELIDGRFTDRTGTWSNFFRLVSVVRDQGPGTVSGVNLPARTAVVTVPDSTISNQTVIEFTNTFAIPAVIEICKRALDLDVTGFFDFTVDAIAGQVFTVPTGFCSGAIQVLVPTAPGPPLQESTVIVTELGRAGFNLDSGSTFPANRFVALVLGSGVTNNTTCSVQSGDVINGDNPPAGCTFSNPGGGYIIGRVVEGDTSNQTTFNFFNRSAPGIVKVCKIAGPGIPIGAEFDFLVQGTVAGPTQPFAPGTIQNRRVRVQAGPDTLNGGFCQFVRNDDGSLTQFVVGTPVYVREYDYIEGTGQTAVDLSNGGSIRVGRIRMELGAGAFVAAPAASIGPSVAPSFLVGYTSPSVTPNPRLGQIDNNIVPQSTSGPGGQAVFLARRGTREIEYVNFVFRPGVLKICKIAGAGVVQGTEFTFSVAIGSAAGFPGLVVHPAPVANVTVQAGPAASGGFCAFAQGPYDPTATTPPVGTFPVGFPVTVTEVGGNVTAVSSPTGTVVNPVLGANGAGTLVITHWVPGFNEIVFTNGTAAPVQTGFTLSGRVMTPSGGGLRNAQVLLVGADGSKFSVPTNSMGYYSFDSLSSQAYRATVVSRRYKFEARDIELNNSLSAVDFTGLE